MLTPTRREVVETPAYKVPAGAQLWGGTRDGATVQHSQRVGWAYLLLLEDGTEILVNQSTPIAWLHPAGRRTPA